MRILVAEHDARTRRALGTLLRQQPGLTVDTCGDMVSLAARTRDFRPDLVLLDWELPGRPAAAVLYVQNGPAPRPPVIVMSCRPESESAALAAGAEGFVSKADPPGVLLAALRRLVRERAPAEGEVASARDAA